MEVNMFTLGLIAVSLIGLIALAIVVKKKFSGVGKILEAISKRFKGLDKKDSAVNSEKEKSRWSWKNYIAVLCGIALTIYLAAIISGSFTIGLIICLLILLIAALTAFRLIMTIPTNNVAIKTLFGKRRKGFIGEGLCGRLPFEKLLLYPIVPTAHKNIMIEATSRDDLKLTLHLSFEFCYDPSITENGICVFSGYDSDDVIIEGITDELKLVAKSIIGVSTAQEINISQKEINLLLNVIARLSNKSSSLKLHPTETISYYKNNFADIEKKLDAEHLETADHSRLEEKYGVDITRVDLVIEYSDEARKILEKNKVAEEESLVSKKIIETVENLKKAGLTADKAASSALLIYKKDNTKLWIKDINIAGVSQLPEIIEKAVKLVFGKEGRNA
jgi:regulator of protease activity HflC (stomatin/prohibitin superfamily)